MIRLAKCRRSTICRKMAAFSVYFANCKNFPEYKIVKFAGFYMAPMNFFTILHNAIFGAGSSDGFYFSWATNFRLLFCVDLSAHPSLQRIDKNRAVHWSSRLTAPARQHFKMSFTFNKAYCTFTSHLRNISLGFEACKHRCETTHD